MLVVVMSVVFTSCKDDDEPSKDSDSALSKQIVGTWVVMSANNYLVPGETLTFTASGKVSYMFEDEGKTRVDHGTYTLNEEELICFIDNDIWEGTVEIEGTLMTYRFLWEGYSYVVRLAKR